MNDVTEPTLAVRLSAIERLEDELMHKAAAVIGKGAPIHQSDMFVLGATKRALAQSNGFRNLIAAKNFPCAAAILRLQIDTAMRVNALSFVANVDELCGKVMGGMQFNKMKDVDGIVLSDAHLRKKLAELYPQITNIYRQTSDFVHLSGRHFYSSIAKLNHEDQTVYLQISGKDPQRPDEDYFEIVDAFFNVTRVAALMILGFFTASIRSKVDN